MARLVLSAAVAATLSAAALVPAAVADICMYQNAQGEITYSNVTAVPPKNSKKLRCFREEKKADTEKKAQPRANTQTEFPSVDKKTQRRRDDERLNILEAELSAELSRLATARQTLEEQESVRLSSERNYQRYLDRVQPFRDAVANHERNVQAIQSEIDNMR